MFTVPMAGQMVGQLYVSHIIRITMTVERFSSAVACYSRVYLQQELVRECWNRSYAQYADHEKVCRMHAELMDLLGF